MPANRSTGYIKIRYSDGSISELDLPVISSIEMTMTTQLTEMDTIIYGYENRFIIDLGTVQRYTLELERVNPFPYNDSNNAPPEQWSNGKWYLHLESMLNRWQTLFRSFSGDSILGAFLLHIDSGDTALYPDIDKYVVVSGSMSVKRTVQKMTISIPLTVARLPGSAGTANTMTVTFGPGEGSGNSFTQSYAVGFSAPLPDFPSSWTAGGGAMVYQWESDDGSIVANPGDYITWASSTPTNWHATWRTPYFVAVYETPGENQEYIVDRVCRVVSYAVGGGGGAGGWYNQNMGTYVGAYHYSGGGGASGEVSVRSFNANPGTIYVTVGRGGVSGGSESGGSRGETSSVTYLGRVQNFAEGGSGGGAARYTGIGEGGGTGGVGNEDNDSYSGGSTGPNWDTKGGDGEQGTGDDAGQAGVGSEHHNYESLGVYDRSQGGAGGGASDFNYTFNGRTYRSKGGDGGVWRPNSAGGPIAPSEARYGGGAGSGGPMNDDVRRGGSGIVILVLFER